MKTATVAELHEHLDEYLDAVRAGETVEIRDEKGRFARLEPPIAEERHEMEDLIAAGKLRRQGNGNPPDDLLTRRLAKFSSGSVLEALLEERKEGW
jgi:antitoxin (DNA-binding transcriptional repressor) of toxin-antitoxin stability system